MAKGMESSVKQTATEQVTIKPLNMRVMAIRIKGEAPLVIHRFSHKAKLQIRATQEAGPTAKSKKAREARDFQADFVNAQYFAHEGWSGLSAAGFRNACISACRVAGFQMTKAKLSIFIEPDGFDALDETPLVRIEGDKPEELLLHTRNETGVIDLRMRPMWRKWAVNLRLRYDGDQFTASDVVNLINRAGLQVGVGEGRPDSKKSAGIGYGLFSVDTDAQVKEEAA